jgi:hypothetical protein
VPIKQTEKANKNVRANLEIAFPDKIVRNKSFLIGIKVK